MKMTIIIASIGVAGAIFSMAAQAEPGDVPGNVNEAVKETYMVDGHRVSKVEAVKALLADKPVQKIKACDAALSKNLGIRCKKAPKKFANVATEFEVDGSEQ